MIRRGRTTQSRMEESRRMFWDNVPEGIANDPGGGDIMVAVADDIVDQVGRFV